MTLQTESDGSTHMDMVRSFKKGPRAYRIESEEFHLLALMSPGDFFNAIR